MPRATTGEIVEMLAETLVSNRNKPLKNRGSRELDIASTDRGTSVVYGAPAGRCQLVRRSNAQNNNTLGISAIACTSKDYTHAHPIRPHHHAINNWILQPRINPTHIRLPLKLAGQTVRQEQLASYRPLHQSCSPLPHLTTSPHRRNAHRH
jgi:hypothetical protein